MTYYENDRPSSKPFLSVYITRMFPSFAVFGGVALIQTSRDKLSIICAEIPRNKKGNHLSFYST
jgi:hypothetical protein